MKCSKCLQAIEGVPEREFYGYSYCSDRCYEDAVMGKKPGDAVEHPQHYTQGKFEVIEVIEQVTSGYKDGFVAHCVGTATKYQHRAPFKHASPLEDLKKAAKYLEFAIAYLEQQAE